MSDQDENLEGRDVIEIGEITEVDVPSTLKVYDDEIISITEDRLFRHLSKNIQYVFSQRYWYQVAALIIALFLPLVTSDFKEFIGIDGVIWEGIMKVGLIGSIVWLVVLVIKFRNRITVDDLIDIIKKNKNIQTKRRN